MALIGSLVVDLTMRTAKFAAATRKVGEDTKKLNRRFAMLERRAQKAGRSIEQAFSGRNLLIGVGASVYAFTKFSKKLREVSTLVDENTFNMGKLEKAAKSMSVEFGVSATDVLQSFYEVLSAGADSFEVAAARVAASTKLAVGGVADLGTATQLLTGTLNAYKSQNITATDAADKFFTTVKLGKTTISELGAVMGKSAAIAAPLGVTLGDLSASFVALTLQGINTAEAGTGIQRALTSILKPAASAQIEAKRLGIDFSAAGLKALGFAGFMELVAEKTDGSLESLAKLFPGERAYLAALTLTGAGLESFLETSKAMNDTLGAADEAYKKVAEGAHAFDQALQLGNRILLEYGDTVSFLLIPALGALVENQDAVVAAFTVMGVGALALFATVNPILTAIIAAGIAMGFAWAYVTDLWADPTAVSNLEAIADKQREIADEIKRTEDPLQRSYFYNKDTLTILEDQLKVLEDQRIQYENIDRAQKLLSDPLNAFGGGGRSIASDNDPGVSDTVAVATKKAAGLAAEMAARKARTTAGFLADADAQRLGGDNADVDFSTEAGGMASALADSSRSQYAESLAEQAEQMQGMADAAARYKEQLIETAAIQQEAFGETFIGRLSQLTEGFDKIGSSIAGVVAGGISQFSSGMAKVIVQGGKLSDVFKNVFAGVVQGIIQVGIQMLITSLIGKLLAKTSTAVSVAAATATAAAWAIPAALVSLASFGANAGPAQLALTSTAGVAAGLAAASAAAGTATAFAAHGGYITGPGSGTSDSIPARLSDGEFVIRASEVAANRDILESINSGISGQTQNSPPDQSEFVEDQVLHNYIEVNVNGQTMLDGANEQAISRHGVGFAPRERSQA